MHVLPGAQNSFNTASVLQGSVTRWSLARRLQPVTGRTRLSALRISSFPIRIVDSITTRPTIRYTKSSWRVRTGRPDDGGSKYQWNVGKLLPKYTAQKHIKQSYSFSPPWQPEILPTIMLMAKENSKPTLSASLYNKAELSAEINCVILKS
jgi:hypothetical protein